LRQSEAVEVIFLGDPAAMIDQVALHVSGKSDGAAEADRSQPKKIGGEAQQ